MATLPVWFLETDDSEGSAVLVCVRKVGSAIAEQRLLTAQHVLRTADQRAGAYTTSIKGWAPEVGFRAETAVPLTIDAALSPDAALPLADPEDIAFLILPPAATGSTPSGLLSDEECAVGLNEIVISGYIAGAELIAIHQAVVRPAPFEAWKYENHLAASASGILSPGKGAPKGGVSGGGLFHQNRYLGIYRGEFESVGQHLFIPVRRIREWCLTRGYELVDLTVGAQVGVITGSLASLEPLVKTDTVVKAALDASRNEMQVLKSVLAEFRIYKLLHDHLHVIQQQYVNAAKAARAESFDEDALDSFQLATSGIGSELARAQGTLKEIPPSSAALKARESAWVKKLKEAMIVAETVTMNGADAVDACNGFARILRTHLPRINAELVISTQVMNMDELGALFAQIAALPGIAAPTAADFKLAQQACELVRQAIDQQTGVHDQWQGIDVTLWDAERAAAAAADSDGEEFVLQWKAMNKALGPLLAAAPGAAWATALTTMVSGISALAADASWKDLPRKFDRLARGIRQRFFQVDLDLKEHAEKVAELGKPLELLA